MFVLVVIDHFGSGAGAGAVTGLDPPAPDVAAGARPVDRVITGRDDTSDDTLAADPAPPVEPDTFCLFDEPDDVVEEPDETPRVECEPWSEELSAPVSASAT